MWYWRWHSIALALAGRNDEAIVMLKRLLSSNKGVLDAWFYFEVELAYDGLRDDPRFIEMSHGRRCRPSWLRLLALAQLGLAQDCLGAWAKAIGESKRQTPV